jgi:hypothetical protein
MPLQKMRVFAVKIGGLRGRKKHCWETMWDTGIAIYFDLDMRSLECFCEGECFVSKDINACTLDH